jgi:two-component system sensor histidine kinase VanS
VRLPGLSVRVQLTLSYAVFVIVVGLAFVVVGFLLLRFIPDGNLTLDGGGFAPSRSDLVDVYLKYTLWALLVLSVLGLGGGWILAGRMLTPLTRITETARLVRDGELDRRIRMPGRRNELADLADTFDEMLDRQQEAFEVQERFAANASHELRTPLAVTATMLDVALRDPNGQDYPALLERLRITNQRAVALTESLLRLADANEIRAVAAPVALDALVRATIEENADEAFQRRVTITTQLEPSTVDGDAELLVQLASNLVQNAIRHNGSPGSAVVSTRSDARRRLAVLCVESTGADFDASSAARLAEPFLRGAGRITTDTRGHGLGLALVRRIAEVHGGALGIVPRGGGGLVVTVELPAVSDAQLRATQPRVAPPRTAPRP